MWYHRLFYYISHFQDNLSRRASTQKLVCPYVIITGKLCSSLFGSTIHPCYSAIRGISQSHLSYYVVSGSDITACINAAKGSILSGSPLFAKTTKKKCNIFF